MATGRTPEQEQALLAGIARVVQEPLGAPPGSIRVWIDEFSPESSMAAGELLSDKRAGEGR
jgi:4-oxalocrotonate tautomerase family enzyme